MDKTVIDTLSQPGQRVTSSYAEIYYPDGYCSYDPENNNDQIEIHTPKNKSTYQIDKNEISEWQSPSDVMIGILELKPPFTSRIFRGIAHEGILAIGDTILAEEHKKILKLLQQLLQDNNDAWEYVKNHELQKIDSMVENLYKKIYKEKSKIMSTEITNYYESNLQELEDTLKNNLNRVLIDAHTKLVTELNFEIKKRLLDEKKKLEKGLWDRYFSEIKKVNLYYGLLLDNEYYRHNELIKYMIIERNDALKAFYKYYEAETTTSTMYILSSERKKCRINKFVLNKYQTTEIQNNLDKIKVQGDILERLNKESVTMSEINKGWEQKLEKVMQLFLKFMGFSLKLLPEQSAFLLDLKTMLIMQLSEIQKTPEKEFNILVTEEDIRNTFEFKQAEPETPVCDAEPFEIEGDLSDLPPIKYGSRDTLASDVDLPYFKLQKNMMKYIYAKCQKIDEVKAILNLQRCKCRDSQPDQRSAEQENISEESIPEESRTDPDVSKYDEFSIEPLLVSDFKRLAECPARYCKNWAKSYSFPNLESYVDFTDQKLEIVKAILGKPQPDIEMPEFLEACSMAYEKLRFSENYEPFRHVSTQYSEPNLDKTIPSCTCIDNEPLSKQQLENAEQERSNAVEEALKKRKNSILNLVEKNPKVLLILGYDEAEKFQM